MIVLQLGGIVARSFLSRRGNVARSFEMLRLIHVFQFSTLVLGKRYREIPSFVLLRKIGYYYLYLYFNQIDYFN